MSTNIKLKRSSVPNNAPTTEQLDFGEIAINTADGKLFFKKDDGSESIVTVREITEDNLVIDPTPLNYSSSSTLASVLDDIDQKVKDLEDEEHISSVVSDTTLSGDGTTATPLSVNYTTLDGRYLQVESDTLQSVTDRGSVSTNGITVPSVSFGSDTTLEWDTDASALKVDMGSGLIQQIGEEIYYPKKTKNATGSTIPAGTPVMMAGGVDDDTYIAPAIANGSISSQYYLGVTAEDIPNNSYGRITYFGTITDIDTSSFNKGDLLYVSPTSPGSYTTTKPLSPNLELVAAIVTKSHATEGRLFVRSEHNSIASEVPYDNNFSTLLASNVQAALDELQNSKADVSALASNINLFPTTAAADVTGYTKLVTSKTDPSYDTTAVSVPTGGIPDTETLLGELVSEAGLIDGNLAGVTVTVVGNIQKTSGSIFVGAHFYFKIFHRDGSGTETELVESNHTPGVFTTNGFEEFSSSGFISNTIDFDENSRIVFKFYGISNMGTPEYNFQFGGQSPIRCLLPVPISVIPDQTAGDTPVDSSGFNGILNNSHTNVQSALDAIDTLTIDTSSVNNLDDILTDLGVEDDNREFKLIAGSNISLSVDSGNKRTTISSTDTNDNDYLTGLSFNTSSGVLTATVQNQSDVTVDLDDRYVLIEDNPSNLNSVTVPTVNQTVVDTFDGNIYRTAKYLVQVTSGTHYHVSEILLIHNGTNTFITEYGTVFTESSLATFDASVSGTNIRLMCTVNNAGSTVKVHRLNIGI